MKTKLNIFCVCIILSLLLSVSGVVNLFYQMVAGGFKAGMEAAETGVMPHIPNYEPALTLPVDLISRTGTVENLKDGTQIAIKPIMSMLEVPEGSSVGGAGLLSWVMLFLIIRALKRFFQLIRNINRGLIFDWKNVKYLRRLGILLLAAFACYASMIIISNYHVSQLVELRGCDFSYLIVFSDPILPLGFVSLLVGEIFAIGLRMKEEQDLTI